MARSNRIAGGWNCPTDGKLPLGHSRLKTIMPVDVSSRIAMWTASVSPHKPDSVISPSRSRAATLRQISSSTMVLGHGRWRSTRERSRSASLSGTVTSPSSQNAGDMLEPRDEGGRQINACHENQGQMREHRYIGGLNRRPAADRFAEGKAVKPQQQRPEANHQAENQRYGEQWCARKSRAHYQKFAHENAQRRHARDRHHAEYQPPAKHRMSLGH